MLQACGKANQVNQQAANKEPHTTLVKKMVTVVKEVSLAPGLVRNGPYLQGLDQYMDHPFQTARSNLI